MNFLGIGGFEIVVIVGLAFLFLGPKKMIETSRSAGKLLRDLRAERDKFTSMVMKEFDEGEGGKKAAAGSRSQDDADHDQTPDTHADETSDEPSDTAPGAVSRSHGGIGYSAEMVATEPEPEPGADTPGPGTAEPETRDVAS